jgi:hypothetical protein
MPKQDYVTRLFEYYLTERKVCYMPSDVKFTSFMSITYYDMSSDVCASVTGCGIVLEPQYRCVNSVPQVTCTV